MPGLIVLFEVLINILVFPLFCGHRVKQPSHSPPSFLHASGRDLFPVTTTEPQPSSSLSVIPGSNSPTLPKGGRGDFLISPFLTFHRASIFFFFHEAPLAWWHGRAVQLTPERRRALPEPFDKSQDQLHEFARHRTCPEQGRRSQRTAQSTRRRAMPRPTWFWVLLPKQKDLFARRRNPGI